MQEHPAGDFDASVFINCPFDDDYRPILEAIAFCVVDCGLAPRVSTERLDSGEARLAKIVELMTASRYSIHDLSRVQASARGEYARLNMPFELGIDHGLAQGGDARLRSKRLLVVAEDRHKHRIALSDIAGWDIDSHGGAYDKAIRCVRTWLASHHTSTPSASTIIGHYIGFQEWDYERLLGKGWDETDIRERRTPELLDAMRKWVAAGRPATN
ncbi:MAG: hypothetical protein QNJ12_01000 [Ilumatobacter sp.]|uniref:hypothetical protein n=1 Tax=Ilumatobacter sp. TaxID=1967498 RepID=UPI0026085F29|nr:hypothetical protein [Ilumatobacter sp.]MDJ0767329.1 hypothetical protein [Ilumatobacter sp.]